MLVCSVLYSQYLSFSSSSRQRSWPSLPADSSPFLGKAVDEGGPGAPEPPAAPEGAPEEEEAELEEEDGGGGSLVLGLKAAGSRLIPARRNRVRVQRGH